MKVLVIGTGYVGLNTGVVLAYLGHDVTCLDVNSEKIEMLKQGKPPIYEPNLDTLLTLAYDHLHFTTDYDEADIPNTDVVFIAVGTPSLPDGGANLEYVAQAARSVGARLDGHFTVIVNKSTVPIGSGNWVTTLIRDAYQKSQGHRPHGNYFIASNPEFLRQGSALYDTFYPDRIVLGAEDPRAIDILTNLYRPLLNQDFTAPESLPRPEGFTAVPLVTCDLASAEMIKYAANSFLALKISYINEIAHLAEKVGADITQIARGIGLDSRIGPRFLNAGIGWGGSCFGKDTAALISTACEYNLEMPIIEAARNVNYQLREEFVMKAQQELKILKGKTVTLLGLAFKPNTDDLRDAPAIDIAKMLLLRGAKVHAHDPVAIANMKRQYPELAIDYFEDANEAVQDSDAVLLVTEWPLYKKLDWKTILKDGKVKLLDGRNFF
ncbi:MAG: UDP-glucose 6-dehydrogenase [Chloroflexi bacterium 44-23]|nr:MAG: UDP-glucose 6-dehydrogenase [Chloroflexi bacterium 44-23]